MASFTIGYQNGFADSKKANGVGGQGWVSQAADRPTHLHAVGSVHTLHALIVCSCIYSASNFEVKCAPCPRLLLNGCFPHRCRRACMGKILDLTGSIFSGWCDHQNFNLSSGWQLPSTLLCNACIWHLFLCSYQCNQWTFGLPQSCFAHRIRNTGTNTYRASALRKPQFDSTFTGILTHLDV
jgi:hypothetical protein